MVKVGETRSGNSVLQSSPRASGSLHRANERLRDVAGAILAAPLEGYGARWSEFGRALVERERVIAVIDYGPTPGAMPFLDQLDDPRDVTLRAKIRARIDELTLAILCGEPPEGARLMRERLKDLDARYPLARRR